MTRIARRLVAASAVIALAAGVSACAPAAPEKADDLTVTWLAYNSTGGTTGTTVLSRTDPETPGDFRVEFSANEVGGIGSQSQAGAWNAAIVATILMGEPLEGSFRFETDGYIDGPSAGALTTVGLIALSRGETLAEEATMTGTINATGTIGPVGGIPEKIEGAAEAGFERVLIPLGQRNTTNAAGEEVDVVRAGERLGVEVLEVGDVYEAYEELVGVDLSPQGGGREPRLDGASYDKVQPQVAAALSRYDDARAGVDRLTPVLAQVFQDSGALGQVSGYADQARDLQRQGLQAGAYSFAIQAAAMMEALQATGELVQPLFSQGLAGLDTLFTQAMDVSSAEQSVFAFLDQLSTYTPETIADVEGLLNAYAGTFDAYSLLTFGKQEIESIQQRWAAGSYASLDELFGQMLMPVFWAELAKAQISSSASTLEIGRDNPGAALAEDVDLAQVGAFFRRGAEANFAAFEEGVAAPLAQSRGMSTDAVLSALAQADLTVAAAITQSAVQPGIAAYIGEGEPNADYATLGYGISNYVRNQALLDKYYNNAVLDENLQITDVSFDAVIGRALDLGRDQLTSEIALLRESGTEPVISVGSYEVANLLRQGEVSDQFAAISGYNGSFLTARVLVYLGALGSE